MMLSRSEQVEKGEVRMPNCPNCGTEVPSDAKFCTKCGADLRRSTRPREALRTRHEPDVLGAVSAGMILIILAVTYLMYPIDWSVVPRYFEEMGRLKQFIKPPLILFNPAIFFFNLIAVMSLAMSGLRALWERNIRGAINDLAGGLFSFFIAFLLTNYRDNIISARTGLALLIVGIGGLVMVNAIVSSVFRRRFS